MKEHKRKDIIQIPESELRHRYLGLQQSSSEIAKVFKCSAPTVVARLNKYGIPNRGIKEAKNTKPSIARSREIASGNTYCRGHYKVIINENELRHRYLELQQSTNDIAKIYGCSCCTIKGQLGIYDIPIRSCKEAHNIKPYLKKFIIDIPKQELYDKYIINKLTMVDITKEYKCSLGCVRNNLRRYGITRRSEGENRRMLWASGRIKAIEKSPETLEKARQAMIKRYSDPLERIKTGEAGRKYHREHPEFSVKQTKRLLSYRNNPEMMKRMSESLKKTFQDPVRKAKRSKQFKEMWLDPILRKKMIATRKQFWQDKDNPEVIQRRRRMMAGMNLRPNKPESIILNILDDLYPNEWKYTGDGQIIIGGLNPDFINVNGQKLIIECFGDYWHKPELKNYRINEGRVDVYAEYGYKTLIIWERETKDIDALKHKISGFVRE